MSSVLNVFERSTAYRASRALPYGAGPRQMLDVYQPSLSGSASGALHPVVIFFYGGSWNRGAREDYAFVGSALAERGMVAVIADYRLYPQVRYPEFLHDCAKAVAWARREIKHYGGDPERIFLAGHSAGAYNAAMLALDRRWLANEGLAPSMLAGWIGLAGPYDFLPIRNPDARPVFFYPDYPLDSQPIDHASAGSPAVFLAAANRDSLVNPERNTAQLAQRLMNRGVAVTVRRYNWVNHVTLVATFSPVLRWLSPLLEDIDVFVSRTPSLAR